MSATQHAQAHLPPHTYSPSYVPRSRPASPALPPVPSSSSASASTLNTPRTAPPGGYSRSTPGSPLVNTHSSSSAVNGKGNAKRGSSSHDAARGHTGAGAGVNGGAARSSPLLNPSRPSPKPINHPLPARPSTPAASGSRSTPVPTSSTSVASSPLLTPRLMGDKMERRGSGLKHELRNGERSSRPKVKKEKASKSDGDAETDDTRKKSIDHPLRPDIGDDAKSILKILSNLPAPLPETLPSTFLPTPRTTPSPTSSSSFAEWAKSSKRRRSLSDDSTGELSSEAGSASGPPRQVGLGLGLSMVNTGDDTGPSSKKKRKTKSASPTDSLGTGAPGQLGRMRRLDSRGVDTPRDGGSASPMMLPAAVSRRDKDREQIKSSLRNGYNTDETTELSNWSREKWTEMGTTYRQRALTLKRRGDAYLRYAGAKPEYLSKVPADPLKGLLSLTDSILIWLYAYWCEEQSLGRVRTSTYRESKPLRDHVRQAWEERMRRSDEDDERDAAKGMVGLMYLIEAVICYHTSSDHLSQLSRRSRQFSNDNHPNSASGPSSIPPMPPTPTHPSTATAANSADTKSSHGQHGPSPPSVTGASPAESHLSHRSSSLSITNSNGPSGSGSGSAGSPSSSLTLMNMNDILPLISSSTSFSSSAQHHLLNSRHHLSLRLLRTQFPETFESAIHSELADEALPAPGDTLGSAKRLDIDNVGVFAWPIELGMHAPVAHTAVFGRCMVNELGESSEGGWNVLED